jgi:hypothetical protein
MTTFHRPDDMTCDAFANALSAYLEGELDGAQAAAVRAHATSCADCGALLADLEGIVAGAAALPTLTPSRDLWSGIEARIEAPVVSIADRPARRSAFRGLLRSRALAAAALVFVTAGVTYVATRWSLQESAQEVAKNDPKPVPTPRPGPVERAQPQDQAEIAATLAEGTARAQTDGLREATRSDPVRPTGTGPERAGGSSATLVRRAQPEDGVLPADGVYGREITRLRALLRERSASLDPATVREIDSNLRIIDSAIVRSRAALAKDPASGFLTEQLTSALEKKVELLRTAATLPAARS